MSTRSQKDLTHIYFLDSDIKIRLGMTLNKKILIINVTQKAIGFSCGDKF
jgi:predicted double-glycine peptidase